MKDKLAAVFTLAAGVVVGATSAVGAHVLSETFLPAINPSIAAITMMAGISAYFATKLVNTIAEQSTPVAQAKPKAP